MNTYHAICLNDTMENDAASYIGMDARRVGLGVFADCWDGRGADADAAIADCIGTMINEEVDDFSDGCAWEYEFLVFSSDASGKVVDVTPVVVPISCTTKVVINWDGVGGRTHKVEIGW